MNFWSLDKKGKVGDNFFCNLHQCCKKMNYQELKTGKRQTTFDAIENCPEFDPDFSTLITHAGDWGIKKQKSKLITKLQSVYTYKIEGAAHSGCYLNLEIDSILPKVKRWFTSNLEKDIAPNIYPIPINIWKKDWDGLDINNIRQIEKENLCYANFTMTSNYRITVAEWAWRERYIDCYFPKRYEHQDIELSMPILKHERMPMKEFAETLASYHFCVAPTGNGLDCFRTWECILCNTVPIVQDNWMNRVFSQIWPMILVHKYEFTNVYEEINKFHEQWPHINYNYSLLLEENFEDLLNRIEYESNRLRRELVQMES